MHFNLLQITLQCNLVVKLQSLQDKLRRKNKRWIWVDCSGKEKGQVGETGCREYGTADQESNLDTIILHGAHRSSQVVFEFSTAKNAYIVEQVGY